MKKGSAEFRGEKGSSAEVLSTCGKCGTSQICQIKSYCDTEFHVSKFVECFFIIPSNRLYCTQ